MKIVLCGETFPTTVDLLRPLLPADRVIQSPPGRIREEVRDADVIVPLMTRVDAALLSETRAVLVQQWGAGLEGVDVDAASARGIYVCNAPSDATPNAESTAEHAVFLMMAAARRMRACTRAFAEGLWGAPMGESLMGKRALIFGFGRIGRALARRLVALGMTVDAVRRAPVPADAALVNGRMGGSDDLLRFCGDADFLVCTASASRGSRGIIGAEVFGALPAHAFVVNVSRGALIDEPALVVALKGGRLAGAALDVFAVEPPAPDHPLLQLENVVATPHVAGVTRQSYEAIGRIVAENVKTVAAGGEPRYCVNRAAVRSGRSDGGSAPVRSPASR